MGHKLESSFRSWSLDAIFGLGELIGQCSNKSFSYSSCSIFGKPAASQELKLMACGFISIHTGVNLFTSVYIYRLSCTYLRNFVADRHYIENVAE